MIRAAIKNIPEEKWTISEGEWYYAYTLYHIIETMDFYSREDHEGMVWGKRAGYKWDDVTDVKEEILHLISRELVTSYLSEMEEKLSGFLSTIVEDAFFEKDGFYWFESVYQKFIYLLRHTQHHLGELAVTLRKFETEPIKWVQNLGWNLE